MTVLMLLIGLSVAIIAIAGVMFIWAVDNGQFEELDRHAFDVLDDPPGKHPRS